MSIDPTAALLVVRARDGAKILQNEIQEPSRTIRPGHFGRTIEAVKPELEGVCGFGVVASHPFDHLAVRIEPAKAVAEPRLTDVLVVRRATTGNILVNQVSPWKTALD